MRNYRVKAIELHDSWTVAQAEADKLLAKRNDAIRAALEEGVRPADLARSLDLTRARVTQIAQQD